jgi:DNA invertase Pin-like site-specific DNA recombinase
MKYVAYYRVSTDKQGKSGLGLESQQASVQQFIKAHRGKQIDEFTEIESGKKNDRPQLERALRRCLLTGATLIIAKLDRLSRDIAFIANLQKSKVDFTCVDMPEANTLTIGMMAVLAQYERELISERTKAGLQAAKRRGQVLGNPNLHLVRNTDTIAATEAHIANAESRNEQVRELIAEFETEEGRALSAREIASRLNNAGYTTARGKEFSHVQVLRIKAA